MPYTYEFEQIGLTADMVAFAVRGSELHTMLVKRRNEPYKGCWAVPGGYVEIDELFEEAARREFREETGLDAGPLHFFGIFDALKRDPRRRVATAAYYLPFAEMPEPEAGDDAVEVAWVRVGETGNLAFDHDLILEKALSAMRRDILIAGVLPEFLPELFTAGRLDEVVIGLLEEVEVAKEVVELLGTAGIVEEGGEGCRMRQTDPSSWTKALAPVADALMRRGRASP